MTWPMKCFGAWATSLSVFDKVGKDIETLHKDYDEAYKKAYTGRQSIVQKANDLKVLGAKESANAPIPETQMRLDEA